MLQILKIQYLAITKAIGLMPTKVKVGIALVVVLIVIALISKSQKTN